MKHQPVFFSIESLIRRINILIGLQKSKGNWRREADGGGAQGRPALGQWAHVGGGREFPVGGPSAKLSHHCQPSLQCRHASLHQVGLEFQGRERLWPCFYDIVRKKGGGGEGSALELEEGRKAGCSHAGGRAERRGGGAPSPPSSRMAAVSLVSLPLQYDIFVLEVIGPKEVLAFSSQN